MSPLKKLCNEEIHSPQTSTSLWQPQPSLILPDMSSWEEVVVVVEEEAEVVGEAIQTQISL
jgi:hypothetical protein